MNFDFILIKIISKAVKAYWTLNQGIVDSNFDVNLDLDVRNYMYLENTCIPANQLNVVSKVFIRY